MPTPSLDTIKAYYDCRVDGKLRDFTQANPRIEAAIQTVAEWAPAKPRRILEIGCGVGDTSWRIARAWPQAEVIGADISPTSIEVAKACFKLPNLSYRAALIKEGVFEGRFDLILMIDVYEHIAAADRAELHVTLNTLLSDESRLILAFPTPTLQHYCLVNSPQDLQPVDEDIGLGEIAKLAEDTTTEFVSYRVTGIWHYGDYAHLVLARYQAMADVELREYIHPSRWVRFKQAIKRQIGREPRTTSGLRDYLGPDLMRPPEPFDRLSCFHVSARERRALANAWFKRSQKAG